MKRAFLAGLAVTAFVLAPAATAKGPVSLELCGVSACKEFRWDPEQSKTPGLVIGALNTDQLDFAPSPPLSPYYELELKADWLQETRLFYVPARSALRAGLNWLRLDRGLEVSLRTATGDLAPWPRPTITRALVSGRPAPEPAGYAALLGRLPAADFPAGPGRRIDIVLRAERPTPWTNAGRPLEYYAGRNVLHRQVEWVRLPAALAQLIERDAGLVTKEGRTGFPWEILLGLLGALVLVLTVSVLVLRGARRRVRARAV